MDGSLFCSALYPAYSPIERLTLKFRDFLEAFPDLVEVFPTPSGDRVRILDPTHGARVDELRLRYRRLLVKGLQDIMRIRSKPNQPSEPTVPSIQLAKWLKKQDSSFSPQRLGFSSLTAWLESLSDLVEVTHKEYGGRVRLLSNATALSPAQGARAPVGYLLVDSVDMISALHQVLGAKPLQSQLPDWGALMRSVRHRFPADIWKGRYFMALDPQQADTTEGFRAYLEAVGYAPIPLAVQPDRLDLHRTLDQRASATAGAVSKMLVALRDQVAHILVVSHRPEIAENLQDLLRARAGDVQIGVLCIPDLLPDALRDLKEFGGLILSIENETGAFKQPLPKKRLIAPEGFDPTRYL